MVVSLDLIPPRTVNRKSIAPDELEKLSASLTSLRDKRSIFDHHHEPMAAAGRKSFLTKTRRKFENVYCETASQIKALRDAGATIIDKELKTS